MTYDGSDRVADYTWLGSAANQRDTTCHYPGGTKPKFKTEYQRDGIMRVSTVVNEHVTADQDDYPNLGSWTYGYDAAGNPIHDLTSHDSTQRRAATMHSDLDPLQAMHPSTVADGGNSK